MTQSTAKTVDPMFAIPSNLAFPQVISSNRRYLESVRLGYVAVSHCLSSDRIFTNTRFLRCSEYYIRMAPQSSQTNGMRSYEAVQLVAKPTLVNRSLTAVLQVSVISLQNENGQLQWRDSATNLAPDADHSTFKRSNHHPVTEWT